MSTAEQFPDGVDVASLFAPTFLPLSVVRQVKQERKIDNALAFASLEHGVQALGLDRGPKLYIKHDNSSMQHTVFGAYETPHHRLKGDLTIFVTSKAPHPNLELPAKQVANMRYYRMNFRSKEFASSRPVTFLYDIHANVWLTQQGEPVFAADKQINGLVFGPYVEYRDGLVSVFQAGGIPPQTIPASHEGQINELASFLGQINERDDVSTFTFIPSLRVH